MATMTSDSLFNVSQSFFSQDILQKISKEINQPIEQTRIGLKSAIPTLLMGIVNKGSTKEGAEALVDIANHQPPVDSVAINPSEIKEGNEVVNKIFGNNVNGVISKLGATTGMNTNSMAKMLSMAAPMIMGAIASKVKTEHLGASGLMTFLGQQKSSLANLIPSGIPGLSSYTGVKAVPETVTNRKFWPAIVLLVLVLSGIFWWYNSTRVTTTTVAPETTAPVALSSAGRNDVLSISSLQNFMRGATPGTFKRFRFDNLTFKTGTVSIVAGAEKEIEQIVAVMKANPSSTARIEGYTDNVGLPSNNVTLSNKRAIAVKDELVFRGIRSSRIETAGLGESSPVANNNSATGRAANRRIEFIIKR